MTKQGQGLATEDKQRGFQSQIHITAKVMMKPNLRRYPYFHADLNCGKGMNEDVGCIGSPLAFWYAMQAVGKTDFHAFFCDRNEDNIRDLMACTPIGKSERCYCFHGNNGGLLPVFGEFIAQPRNGLPSNPKKAMGTVLVDPNGWFDFKGRGVDRYAEVPHEALIDFFKIHRRIDLILNLNVRTYWLGKGNIDQNKKGWNGKFWPPVDEILKIFNKDHWLIKYTAPPVGDPFVLLFGRNLRIKEHRNLGLYYADEQEGQAIVDYIEKRIPKEALNKILNAEKDPDLLASLSGIPRVPETPDLFSHAGSPLQAGKRDL